MIVDFLFLLIIFLIFTDINSKFITYTLYQTDDICQHNWKGSICLPSMSLNKTNQPLSIQVDISNKNPCPTQILVYIRSKQCIYCSKNIHCNHERIKRMIPIEKQRIHLNQITIIGVSSLGIFFIGILFLFLMIKRSKAHTNLLELVNEQENATSKKLIKIPVNIKSPPNHPSQPKCLTVPKSIKPTK